MCRCHRQPSTSIGAWGFLPSGDTPRAFWQWWYHVDLATKQRWYNEWGGFDSEMGWAQYVAKLTAGLRRMAAVAADPSLRVSAEFPPVHSGEQHVPIIDALANDHSGIFSVTLPTTAPSPASPTMWWSRARLRRAARASSSSGSAICRRRLMIEILWPRWLEMERDLAAFGSGDRDLLREIVLRDIVPVLRSGRCGARCLAGPPL